MVKPQNALGTLYDNEYRLNQKRLIIIIIL